MLALNVLDRHARPAQLLRQMGSVLRPGGAIVLSVPLPVTQHDAARYTPVLHPAPQSLGLSSAEALANTLKAGEGGVWEAAAAELVLKVLKPQGWRVVSVTRAPYMAAGGTKRTLEPLDAVVVVAVRSEAWEQKEAKKVRFRSCFRSCWLTVGSLLAHFWLALW